MLIPLTRKTFESLIPAIATGAQYLYLWGKLPDLLRRLLISIVGVLVDIFIIGGLLGDGFGGILLLLGIIAGLYWLWGPILWASLRNIECRRFAYSGFWQGEVWDVYVADELIGKEETVNDRGDLVIVENRERQLTLEVGDEAGFSWRLTVPLKRNHQAIAVGDVVQMLVMSNRGDLGRITKTSDIYLPSHNIWVSDYPYLQRDAFVEVSQQLRSRQTRARKQQNPRRRQPYPEDGSGRSRDSDRAGRRTSRRKPSVDW
jgi:hypothetical protein